MSGGLITCCASAAVAPLYTANSKHSALADKTWHKNAANFRLQKEQVIEQLYYYRIISITSYLCANEMSVQGQRRSTQNVEEPLPKGT